MSQVLRRQRKFNTAEKIKKEREYRRRWCGVRGMARPGVLRFFWYFLP
jgi:hypothetical protein